MTETIAGVPVIRGPWPDLADAACRADVQSAIGHPTAVNESLIKARDLMLEVARELAIATSMSVIDARIWPILQKQLVETQQKAVELRALVEHLEEWCTLCARESERQGITTADAAKAIAKKTILAKWQDNKSLAACQSGFPSIPGSGGPGFSTAIQVHGEFGMEVPEHVQEEIARLFKKRFRDGRG